MRRSSTIVSMVLAVAAGMSLAAQPQTGPQPPMGAGITERIRDLNLTESQEAAIAGIREEYAPRVEEAATQLSAVIKETMDSARAVLTPEQKIKLAALKDEGKIWRYESMAERVAHLRDLNLTDEERAKLTEIRKEYRPKIVGALKGLKGILTPEQAKLREEGLKAGKPRKQVLASLNLTDEQKAKVEAVGAEVRGLVREEVAKLREVLNPEQQEKLAAMKEQRREQIRARTLFAVESLKELNLTEPQVTQLKAIHAEYAPRIEDAGNQLRAIIREELKAILNVIDAV